MNGSGVMTREDMRAWLVEVLLGGPETGRCVLGIWGDEFGEHVNAFDDNAERLEAVRRGGLPVYSTREMENHPVNTNGVDDMFLVINERSARIAKNGDGKWDGMGMRKAEVRLKDIESDNADPRHVPAPSPDKAESYRHRVSRFAGVLANLARNRVGVVVVVPDGEDTKRYCNALAAHLRQARAFSQTRWSCRVVDGKVAIKRIGLWSDAA